MEPGVQVVRGVSFRVEAGGSLALVGEKGSGGRECVRALVGVPRTAQVSGDVVFDGTEPAGRTRDAAIGVVSPVATSRLHPLRRIGGQLAALIRSVDHGAGRKAARRRAVELLAEVEVDDPARCAKQYPHRLSPETRQRIMIAMAFAPRPELLIAEEPAEGLPVSAGAAIIDLIHRLRQESGTALLLATSSLAIATGLTDEIIMMYAGFPVERAAPATIRHNPHHPYTKALLESSLGHPPPTSSVPSGCPFHLRCPYTMPVCAAERPPLSRVTGDGDHASACWLPHEATGLGEAAEALRLRFSRPDPA
ncbi:ABC transporter ATP-binding protein [Sphaerisporangium rubeum]